MKPPSPAEIESGLRRLSERLAAWGATAVIVHGSVARGKWTSASDIDLVVLKETGARMPERISDALGACDEADPPLPVEPLVYTPGEFRRLVAEGHPLAREVERHGRVLLGQA